MTVPAALWRLVFKLLCRRRHRGLFYGIQQSQNPAGKLNRSGDCDKVQHRQHLRSRIFRRDRGWLRIDGRCGSNSRRTACSLERLRTLGAADGAKDGCSVQVALPIAENLADVHAMLLFADRADGVNIVTFDVELKTEFFEIKHFYVLSAALHDRFPVFRRAGGGFRACLVVGVCLPLAGCILLQIAC